MGVDIVQAPVTVEIDRLLIDLTGVEKIRRAYREVAEGSAVSRREPATSNRSELASSARRGGVERRLHIISVCIVEVVV